jgi:NADH:ubiquinone oxidoreductase subunit 6 (subunit J)
MNKNFSLFPLVKPVQAQTKAWVFINENCVQDGTATIQGIGCMLANVFSVILTLIGITGFVMIIYSAFIMLTSAGKSQQVEKSRNTITFAIIGIILALSAFIIINIIANFTGVSVIKSFVIPGSETIWF